jgi:type IV pilus assembly protein PilV
MKRTARRWQTGLNLLEVLIATLVLSVGLLGLAGLQVSSLKTAQNASLKQEATFLLYDLLERMRSNRQAVLAGSYIKTTNCNQLPPTSCTAATCSPAQQAAYDVYTVLCKGDSNHLPSGQLVITCPAGGDCSKGLHFLLTWIERVEQRGIQQSTVANGGSTAQTTEKEQDLMSLDMDAII